MSDSYDWFCGESFTTSDLVTRKQNNNSFVDCTETEQANDSIVLFSSKDYKVTVAGVEQQFGNLHILEKLNSLNTFSCDLYGVTQGGAVAENAVFKVYIGQSCIFKGTITHCEFQTNQYANVSGYDQANKLLTRSTGGMSVTETGIETCETDATGLCYITSTTHLAQCFRAPFTGLWTGFDVYVGGGDNVQLNWNIDKDGGGKPGAYLGGGSWAPWGIGFAWKSVTFSPALAVKEGEIYWIYLFLTVSGGRYWYASDLNPYPNGFYAESFDSGATWTAIPARDAYFHATFTRTQQGRIQYTNTLVNTIVSAVCSGVINVNSNAITSPITTRADYDNRLNWLAGIAKQVNCDWWVDQDGSDYDQFNIKTTRGSLTSSYTLTTAGDSLRNCWVANRNKDTEHIYNSIYVLGYGDGANQLVGHVASFTTTSNRTQLNGRITTTATTIVVDNNSSFPASGTLLIGKEQIIYDNKPNSTSFHVPVNGRGANGTTTTAHFNRQWAFDKTYSESSPQTNSSINIYGLIEKTFSDSSIIAAETSAASTNYYPEENVQQVAEKLFLQYELPNEIIDFDLMDTRQTLPALGDVVTVNDADTGMVNLSTWRCVAKERTIDATQDTDELKVSVANIDPSIWEDIQKTAKEQDNLSQYMQGAVNVDSFAFDAKVCKDFPYYGVFTIPNEAIAIDQVKAQWYSQNFEDTLSANIVGGQNNWAVNTITTSFAKVGTISSAGNQTHSKFVTANIMGHLNSVGASAYWIYWRIYDNTNGAELAKCYSRINNTLFTSTKLVWTRIPGSPPTDYWENLKNLTEDMYDWHLIAPCDVYGKEIVVQARVDPGDSAYFNVTSIWLYQFRPNYNTSSGGSFNLYLCDNPSGANPSAWSWNGYSGNPVTNATGIDLTSYFTSKGVKGIKIETATGSGVYTSRVFGSLQTVVYLQSKPSYASKGV
jgi:hypothetical protein